MCSQAYATVGMKQKNKHTCISTGYNFGVSAEFDVLPLSAGSSYAKISKDKNREYNASDQNAVRYNIHQ